MKEGRVRERFSGRIAGVGSTSGVRIVVGRWDDGPWGSFADVMIEDATGHRVLLAPDERVRDFVAATYFFDEHVIEPVEVTDTADGWHVVTSSLRLTIVTGRRTPLGAALGLVPARVATAPAWCAVVVVRRDRGHRCERHRGHVARHRPRLAGARRSAVPVRLLQYAEAADGDERRDDDRATQHR